ncbi:MAG: D-alanyl-D-alanine carboxypeptidase [Lachnospiraceae bacterium]|nr:D-alanyl-D-alanine carboxypeptidase [Lachnospiraceae bacterium]
MKCTNKYKIIAIIVIMASLLCGCGNKSQLWMPFSDYTKTARSTIGRTFTFEHATYDNRYPGFADDLCVFSGNVSNPSFSQAEGSAALLIDSGNDTALYAQNAFEQRYPASITKIMTAYVACKYLSPDSVITCTASVETIDVSGAILLGLKEGDYFTLDQALHLCLLSSYNDVAVAIAEAVSGNVEDFAKLMNDEALKLGCTGTNFVNPSGLPDENHYTTAYDLYLIFNEAINNPLLMEVIQCNDYSTVIHSKNGSEKQVSSRNTNQYFIGNFSAPAGITIVGGKTGTTTDAGHCLIILVRNTDSRPYIALVLGAPTTEGLYNEMSEMLKLCEVSSN